MPYYSAAIAGDKFGDNSHVWVCNSCGATRRPSYMREREREGYRYEQYGPGFRCSTATCILAGSRRGGILLYHALNEPR